MDYKEQGKRTFEHLFVLEMANNHWGRLDRGLKIVTDFGRIVRFNNVKASIKLQFRDVDRFIHKDFRERADIRYIKKTLDTKLSHEEYRILVKAVREAGCIPMATPFDEASVDLCVELDLPLIKIASSDLNDWELIEKIASTRKPVIVSTGGSSQKDIDDLVVFFRRRNILLAINHCVSCYPSEDSELEINQVDFLCARYPDNVIGFSTHEKTDWHNSILLAYAKGARTFERHIDIDEGGIPVSAYCTLPHQCDQWFRAWKKAVEMCGASGHEKRVPPQKEIQYLDNLVRGAYARHDIEMGATVSPDDYYLAVPLQRGQLSCRELMKGEKALRAIKKDAPLMIEDVDSPYAANSELKSLIYNRGL